MGFDQALKIPLTDMMSFGLTSLIMRSSPPLPYQNERNDGFGKALFGKIGTKSIVIRI